MEKERRKEMQSMRTTESQELGNTVAQEMEKKRKIAELKKLQARAKAAERAAAVSSDDSEDDERANLKAKVPVGSWVRFSSGHQLPVAHFISDRDACVQIGACSRLCLLPMLLAEEGAVTSQMVSKKSSDDEDAEEESRKKRQRQAAQRRRGGRMGI